MSTKQQVLWKILALLFCIIPSKSKRKKKNYFRKEVHELSWKRSCELCVFEQVQSFSLLWPTGVSCCKNEWIWLVSIFKLFGEDDIWHPLSILVMVLKSKWGSFGAWEIINTHFTISSRVYRDHFLATVGFCFSRSLDFFFFF